MKLLLINEFKKLNYNTKVLIYLFFLLVINSASLIYYSFISFNYSPFAYKNLSYDIFKHQNSQRYNFITQQFDDLYNGDFNSSTSYTNNINNEIALIEDVLNEFNTTKTYKEYLSSILDKSNSLPFYNIFDNSYDYLKISLIKEKYVELITIQPMYIPQNGIYIATTFPFSPFIMCLAAIIISAALISDDKMFTIIKSTVNGRNKLPVVKLLVLTLYLTIFACLIASSNLIICDYLFNIDYLLSPIQSLPFLRMSPFKLNILSYLIISFFLKLLFSLFIGIWGLIAFCRFDNRILSTLYFCHIPLISFILYKYLPTYNNFNIFKYFNFFLLIFDYDLLRKYTIINLLPSLPIPLINIYPVIILSSLIFFIYQFFKNYLSQRKKTYVQNPAQKLNIYFRKRSLFDNIYYVEIYKSFVHSGGIFVLILAIAFQMHLINSNTTSPSPD